MSDTIGPDGLTDDEQVMWRKYAKGMHAATDDAPPSEELKDGWVLLHRLARERLAHTAEKAAHAETRAALASARETIAAYPAPTTNLAGWGKPTIAVIDTGALAAISPPEEEDEDGSIPWPGQCIGALINGFLDLASDVGRHDRAADQLVHNAVDELRKVSAALREAWADITESKDILSSADLALDVHSSSPMRAHANSVARQATDLLARAEKAEAERDRLRAALERFRPTLEVFAKLAFDKLKAQNARMKEVLLRAGGTDCEGFCIDCGNEPRDRHDKSCIVAELLREK